MDISLLVILCALLGAIVWNLITWRFGLPSSSSHALIGGLMGGGAAAFGFMSIEWHILFVKIILILFITPVIGFAVGFIVMKLAKKLLCRLSAGSNKVIKKLNFLSIILLASSHSTGGRAENDGDRDDHSADHAQDIGIWGIAEVKLISSAMLSWGCFSAGGGSSSRWGGDLQDGGQAFVKRADRVRRVIYTPRRRLAGR
jgi:PiT family inorganic phosphate transporter